MRVAVFGDVHGKLSALEEEANARIESATTRMGLVETIDQEVGTFLH